MGGYTQCDCPLACGLGNRIECEETLALIFFIKKIIKYYLYLSDKESRCAYAIVGTCLKHYTYGKLFIHRD